MILRRIATALRKQDWFSVMIETLIVVLGVFIGLQVNNWNEARQERIETYSLLDRLERDFEQQLGLTERGLAQQVQLIQATGRLITGIRAGQLDQPTLAGDVAVVDSLSMMPGPSAAFQELVSTGRMRLIGDAALRDELYSYDGYVSFARAQFAQFGDPIQALSRVLQRSKTLAISGRPSESFAALGAVEAVDPAILLEDPQILDALQAAYIVQDNYHLVLVTIRQKIERILELLEEERGQAP